MSFKDDKRTREVGSESNDTERTMTKVYIGGLIDDIGNDKLQYEFERFGRVMKVWVARSPHSNGYAFVEFFEPSDAAEAVKEMNGKELFGGKLVVQFSKSGIKKKKSYADNKSSRDTSNYSNMKYDYELKYSGRNTREPISSYNLSSTRRSSSSERINRRIRDRSLNEPSSRNRRESGSYYLERRQSPRHGTFARRSRSPDRGSIRTRSRSRENSQESLLNTRYRRSSCNEISRYRDGKEEINKTSPVDDETIQQIKESIVKETLPQMYSIFLREMLLHDHLRTQNLLPLSPESLQTTPVMTPRMSFTNDSIGGQYNPANLMNISTPHMINNCLPTSRSMMSSNISIIPATSSIPYLNIRRNTHPVTLPRYSSPIARANILRNNSPCNVRPVKNDTIPNRNWNYGQQMTEYHQNTKTTNSTHSLIQYPPNTSSKDLSMSAHGSSTQSLANNVHLTRRQ